MLFVIGGISDGMKMTADGGLRLIRLGPHHGMKSVFPFADVGVAPEEIYRAGAEA